MLDAGSAFVVGLKAALWTTTEDVGWVTLLGW